MAQRTYAAPSMLHICRLRATRLNADGTLATGPHNSIVADSVIDLSWNPVILAGAERDLQGGCDCLIATYRAPDRHKRFDLGLHNGRLDFAALEMLTGAPIINDDSTVPVPIGVEFPTTNAVNCSYQNPQVAIEAWADMWDGGGIPADPAYRYARVVFTQTEWRWDNNTLQADFQPTALVGFTKNNPNWSDFYGDMPFGRSVGTGGGIIFDDAMPTATVGYQTASST